MYFQIILNSINNKSNSLRIDSKLEFVVNNVKEIDYNNRLSMVNKTNNLIKIVKRMNTNELHEFTNKIKNDIIQTPKDFNHLDLDRFIFSNTDTDVNIDAVLDDKLNSDIIENDNVLLNSANTDSLDVINNDISFNMTVTKVHISPLNFESFRGVPISVLPEYFMKLFDSGHHSIVFFSKFCFFTSFYT
jgi:hypothetical protein